MTPKPAWRGPLTLAALAGATLVLGLPDRPRLPVGEITATVMTTFMVDGLRLLLTVSVWYLLLAAVLDLVGRLPGARAVVGPVADRLVAVGVASALRRVMATSVAVGVSLPAGAGAQSADPADEIPVMVPVPGGDREAAELPNPDPPVTTTAVVAPPVMVRQPDPPPSSLPRTDRPRVVPADPAPAVSPPTATRSGDEPRAENGTHVVRRGESFWTIAEDLAGNDGTDPADLASVARRWQRLVDANADNLVDPGNPDLLHVGQVIDLS